MAYPVHVVLMYFSAIYLICLIEHGHTMVFFLPFKISTDLIGRGYSTLDDRLSVYWFTGSEEIHFEGTRRFFSQLNARQKKVSLLHHDTGHSSIF